MRKLLLLSFTALFLFAFQTSIGQQANTETGDNPSARQKYAMELEKDPALGYVPYHRLLNAINHTEALKAASRNGNFSNAQSTPLSWIERGPIFDSVGPSNGNTRGGSNTAGGHTSGRMRAFLLDTLNDPSGNTAFVGGVGGGLWKCTNFLSTENNWTVVNDRFDNLAVSSIAQDPTNPQIIYFSTGEPTDNADRVTGLGVWKSTNGGTTFTWLPSTANYMRCFKIACDAAGNVYLALRIHTTPVNQQAGIVRSTNGGTSWTDITPNNLSASASNSCTDFEFTSSGTLNAMFGYRAAGNQVNHRYTASPATVTPGTWSTSTGFRESNAQAIRTEMAVSGNILYAVTINPAYNTDSCYKSVDGGATWTKQNTVILPAGLGSGQGWYNISLAINPSNTSELISGGLDGYRSTNDGATWTRFTFWVTTAPYVHADHHYAQYWISGGQTRIIMGTDGGLFYSNNNGTTFTSKNKNIGIKQFYSAAIHPTAGSPYLLAGAQDNGTHSLSNPGLSYSIEVTGGDGCIVHINQQNPQIQFGSYVYNQYRRSTNGGASWQSVNLSGSTGQFVNPFDYDDAQNIMYCGNSAGTIRRWDNANTSTTSSIITVSNMTGSLLSVKYSPYTANRIFFGTNNGRLFRLDNANTATTVSATDITGASFPSGTIICVNTGTDDNNLVATYTNYGINNVWVSTNGGTSWTAIDGNLPDMPVRWAMFEPGDNSKLFLATEAGIYTTTNINGASTQWLPETTFPTVSTYMLKMRASDSTIVAGTHGRGLWTAKIPAGTAINPTVTINQAASQADPTSVSPINFTVVFDQAVTGFATGDVTLSGTAGATTGTVTGSGTTYNVAVSGMTSSGTVIANIPAGVAINTNGDPNVASTSTDNTVTFNITGANPNVTINQAASQPDPTTLSPINFTVVFDQVVTGFATGDVTLSGTAGATTGTVTGSGTTYNVAVSGMTGPGTVIATIPAGVAQNASSQGNNASTSTDNTVTFVTCITNPVVQNNADAGAGSLRQAIIDACPGSTITFNMATVTSPIVLTSGELSIAKNLTIQGPGANLLTISGNNASRIFYVNGAGVTGTINRLTLTAGNGAGAVNTGRAGAAYNNGATMNLNEMVLTANTAANGGAVNTAGNGTTNINKSTISNNTSSSSGGGLQNFSGSTTTIQNSTVSGNNSTTSFGGAMQANGTVVFVNSTFSGNSASSSGAGVYFNGSAGTAINCTFTNNTTAGIGGGINKTGSNPFTVRNTIVAGNNGGATAPDFAGSATSQGFNLIGKIDGSTGFTQPTDQTGTVAAPLNPLLGTLANNGGLTLTHALLTNSPAIDKGSAATNPITTLSIITDQRDSIRPYDFPAIPDAAGGNASDIGAFELKPAGACTPPVMNPVPNQTVCAGTPTAPVNFTSTPPGATFSWTNNQPTIGLAASGTGNIASFIPINNTASPITATITVTPSTGSAAAPTPELLHYRFDGTGTTVPNLASAPPAGTATATIVGTQTQGGTGQCGTALVSTGGAGNYVNTGWTTNFSSPFTISFWLGENQVDNNPSYLFGDAGAGSFRAFYGGAALGNNMLLRGGSGDVLITGVNPAATLVTIVYNGTNTTVYKNGAFFQTYAVTFNNVGAGPFRVGGYTSGTAFTGKLDEFRLYNRALSAAEVATLTNCSVGTSCTGNPSSFTITVNPNPSIVIVADPGTTICEGDPTLLTVRLGTQSPVGTLYTQGTTPVNGSPSQVFEPANTAFNSQSADDFIVPAGTSWTVNQVTANGIGAGVPTSVNVFFYSNSASNLPGTAVATFNNITTFTQAGGNYTITLPTPQVLGPGTYWLSVQVNMSFATSGQWFWGNYGAPLVNREYAWQNPGGGFATPCNSWGYGGTGCNVGGGAANVNNIFSLIGTSMADGGPLPPGYTFLWSPAAGLSSTTSNPVAASPQNTTTYTVVVTGPGGPSGCSRTSSILITVNKRPVVTQQPVNRTNCVGTAATFTVGGTGTGLTYQWQQSTTGCAGPWTNLTNGGAYSGVTTATLTVNPVTLAMTGYAYRAVLSGTCAPWTPPTNVSNCAVLTVNPNPAFTVSPTVSCGSTTGSCNPITATGNANTYTWSPVTGLFLDCAATIPYTAGTNAATVYARPSQLTVYTVTGTFTSTGCFTTTTVIVNYTPPAPTITPSAVAMCLGDPAVLLRSSSSTPGSATFNSGTLALAIPDGPASWPQTNFPGVATPNLAVSGIPANATITGMSVKLNLTHTYIADMVIVLKAPNGQVFNLDANINKTGGPGANFINTVISSASTTPLSAGTPPYTGTFAPDAVGATYTAVGFTFPGGPTSPAGYIPTVTNFNGLYSVPNGNWTLGMYDWGLGDLGVLTNWELKIDYVIGVPTTPAVWSPIAGLYSDAAATIPYVAGTRVDSVWARPTPAGVYPYTATVNSLPVNSMFTNPANIVINASGPGTPYPANLTVSGLPTTNVGVDSVRLTGMSHTWGNDIDILLQSPTGQNVILMSDVGGTVAVPNATYTFRDGAPLMNVGGANSTGTYRPTNNDVADNWPAPGPGAVAQATPTLASFGNTANVNGDWKLFVFDDVGGDAGNISGGFTIWFNVSVPACTSPARTVIVTVNNPTTITTQPVNQTVCTDKVATFTVVPGGSGPFTYQWQVSTNGANPPWTNITNGGVYSGATSATLTITNPPVSMNGYYYRVVVTGAAPCAAAISFARQLTVNPLPTIVISASPYTALFPGLRTILSSTVTPNAASSYTWLRNGIPVPGAINQTLEVDVDGLGDYTLRVTDINGCTNTSNLVTISDSASGKCFIYPNPTSGVFQVRYHSVSSNVLPRTLTVYDAKGDRVYTKLYTVGRPYDRMDVDMRAYGKGLYWVEIGDRNGNRLTMCRVVIQ